MAQPQDREEFKQYCLRKAGAPVIKINVSDEQIEDRIDEAISFWTDYHYNGSELVYFKHKLRQLDITRGYIELPDNIIGAVRIFDLGSSIASGQGMWNVTYQFVLNNISDLTGYDLVNYYMSMQHIQFMQEILVGKTMIRYNRHQNRVYLDLTRSRLEPDTYLIIEGYGIIDGDEFSRMWSDRWLQNYATVLIREQWGIHLTKFVGIQMVGGVQFNGEQILADARTERQQMEQEAISGLQPLVYNFIG